MQGFLFTPAIEFKEKALAHLEKLEIEAALQCLYEAQDIDPALADLTSLIQMCRIAKGAGADAAKSSRQLAKLWRSVANSYRARELSLHQFAHLRRVIARQLLALPATPAGFYDDDERAIHRGVCHLVLAQWQEAFAQLLDLITSHPELALPAHWGYWADAAIMLKRWKDANAGYLRLLFTDPHAADLTTFNDFKLRRIRERLIYEEDEDVAIARWPFHAWQEQAVEIPKGKNFMLPHVVELRSLLGSQMQLERTQSLQQFCLCLYIDQANLQQKIVFDVREEMQALEPQLFTQYLLEIERRR